MEKTILSLPNNHSILALGAESAGSFAAWKKGILWHSEDFGDLLNDSNFSAYQRELMLFLKRERIRPNLVSCDLHPDLKTTHLAKKLAKKYRARLVSVQHHFAHVYSAIADSLIFDCEEQDDKATSEIFARDGRILLRFTHNDVFGIAIDGTGYGLDKKIWGGEVFNISFSPLSLDKERGRERSMIKRIAHLENQILIGGEKAIQEPARVIISILSKFLDKNEVYEFVKKYYSRNEFEVLYSQLQQNFNCLETSSCGRILDAVSLLLGFCENEREYKHEAIELLEANSSKPYTDIKPVIDKVSNTVISNFQFPISNKFSMTEFSNEKYNLNTTCLFEYLIENLHRDRKRLAATAQLYIAQGLYNLIKMNLSKDDNSRICENYHLYVSGGIGNNKIISEYLESKGVYASKKIPRGDAGISVGQVMHCLLANPGN